MKGLREEREETRGVRKKGEVGTGGGRGMEGAVGVPSHQIHFRFDSSFDFLPFTLTCQGM